MIKLLTWKFIAEDWTMDRRFSWLLLGTLLMSGAGCAACIQGVAPCGEYGGCSTCGPDLANYASCQGACGEVYIDPWVSDPPCIDNCATPCGGCGQCGQCRPVRSLLRLLWGTPFATNCNHGLCGPTCGGCDSGCTACDSGCTDCGSGYVGEQIMHNNGIQQMPERIDSTPLQMAPTPAAPAEIQPEAVPAPDAAASRLSPVRQRRAVRSASASRRR